MDVALGMIADKGGFNCSTVLPEMCERWGTRIARLPLTKETDYDWRLLRMRRLRFGSSDRCGRFRESLLVLSE